MDKDKKKGFFQRVKMKALMILAVLATVPGIASAANDTFNFTSVINILESMVGIFPPLIDIVLAILPLILVVAVISFIIGIFAGVLDGIVGMFRGMIR